MDQSKTKDRYGLVWTVFLILGLGTLLPWNMFITASDYYVEYKFNPPNATDGTNQYRKNFLAYVGIASKFPNLALQALNFFFAGRIFFSLVVQIAVFILTMVLAFVDTFSWIGLFFGVTMASLVVINMANGVYQSCLFALAANLPKSYTNAVVTGMNVSGTFSALVLILSLIISPNQKTAAIFYFATAVVFLVVCFYAQLSLRKNNFYRSYQVEASVTEQFLREDTQNEQNFTILMRIWPQVWLHAFNIFMVFFVSLSIFPTVIANVKPMNDLIPDRFFNPVFCFLFFNLFAVIGNLLHGQWPTTSKAKFLLGPVLSRLSFIPFFLLCNYNPSERTWPILFRHDLYPIAGCSLLALTSGYLSSAAQMSMPKAVGVKEAPIAGMVASFSCMIGILGGLSFAPILSQIILI